MEDFLFLGDADKNVDLLPNYSLKSAEITVEN